MSVEIERKEPVYIVTDGSYSDYCIRGVFSTEENAEAFRHCGTKSLHLR